MCGDAGTFWEISPKYIAISGTSASLWLSGHFHRGKPLRAHQAKKRHQLIAHHYM